MKKALLFAHPGALPQGCCPCLFQPHGLPACHLPMPHHQPNFRKSLQDELGDGRQWADRAIVLAYAMASGLSVVLFTLMADGAFGLFEQLLHWQGGWAVLLWTPACTAAIVWATRRFAPGAAGSGIPQVMAALDASVDAGQRSHFVSLRLTFAKIVLGAAGFLAGLSIGREGPSVQVAAGVTPDTVGRIKAGELVNFVAQQVGGKGGGKPDMAMAGGTSPAGLPAALASVAGWVAQKL